MYSIKLVFPPTDRTGMSVVPSQFDLIVKLLDMAQMREEVLGQNISNVNTPAYRRQEVQFEDELRQFLSGDRTDKLNELEAKRAYTEGLPARSDGNNVDIEMEMGQLNKNSMMYETYAQVLATKLGMLRSAITGRVA